MGGLACRYGEGFELDVKTRSPDPHEMQKLLSQVGCKASDVVGLEATRLLCERLGKRERGQAICEGGEGEVLWEMMTSSGGVPVSSFCEWWVAQERLEKLQSFLKKHFKGKARLLERSSWFNFRYNLPASGLSLASIFKFFEEEGRESVGISDYSLGQTTMEQLFNYFAAQQENPEVAAAHAGNSGGAGRR